MGRVGNGCAYSYAIHNPQSIDVDEAWIVDDIANQSNRKPAMSIYHDAWRDFESEYFTKHGDFHLSQKVSQAELEFFLLKETDKKASINFSLIRKKA